VKFPDVLDLPMCQNVSYYCLGSVLQIVKDLQAPAGSQRVYTSVIIKLYGCPCSSGEPFGDPLYIHRQSCYLFGRERRVADVPTDHPSCSKQHAVLQYRYVLIWHVLLLPSLIVILCPLLHILLVSSVTDMQHTM
jgi:hypothetical protein